MKKETLIELAKEKNFISTFLYNKPYAHNPVKEELRWYFWLCEVQKWLHDDNNWFLGIVYDCHHNYDYHGYNVDYSKLNMEDVDEIGSSTYRYNSSIHALEKGICESLKLIK